MDHVACYEDVYLNKLTMLVDLMNAVIPWLTLTVHAKNVENLKFMMPHVILRLRHLWVVYQH